MAHLSAGNKKTEQQQLRRQVIGFTPWTDPVAMMLRSPPSLSIALNIRPLRVAVDLLQPGLKLQEIKGQELPFTDVCVGVGPPEGAAVYKLYHANCCQQTPSANLKRTCSPSNSSEFSLLVSVLLHI